MDFIKSDLQRVSILVQYKEMSHAVCTYVCLYARPSTRMVPYSSGAHALHTCVYRLHVYVCHVLLRQVGVVFFACPFNTAAVRSLHGW